VVSAGYTHLKFETDHLTLIPIGDVHFGADTSRFREVKELVKNASENTYFVLLGDLVDYAIKQSIANVYDQSPHIEGQTREIWEFLEQNKNKIIGAVSGNHEYRMVRQIGIDPIGMKFEELGIPYHPYILILEISVGNGKGRGSRRRSDYVLVLYHGYTGARTAGGKINGNLRITEVIPTADVYLTGHTHQPSFVTLGRLEVDKYNKKLRTVPYFMVTVPAWLGYEDYAARIAMRPSGFSFVKLEFSGERKEITVNNIVQY